MTFEIISLEKTGWLKQTAVRLFGKKCKSSAAQGGVFICKSTGYQFRGKLYILKLSILRGEGAKL
jgi:hypothetical protein